jgi:hypothetical protein
MVHLSTAMTRHPRLGWILLFVVPLIVEACSNGGGKGY